ncbi:hypothetical protein D3C81_2183370 [compost metagenome]
MPHQPLNQHQALSQIQAFDVRHHHRIPPETATRHTIQLPNTNPTQIKPNEFKALKLFVLSVLGLLGFFSFAWDLFIS